MFEVYASQLNLVNTYIIIIYIYRLSTGNFYNFLSQLDSTLKYLYNTTIDFVVCGDIYVKFYKYSNFKFVLSCLLQSYNLFHIVDFSTRLNRTSCSIIDSVFIDNSSHVFKVLPIINGLSDHDSQYLTVNHLFLNNCYNLINNKRLITKATISNLVTMLKDESWRDVYSYQDINKSFNSFLIHF
jgi:hypothetical protein